MITSQDLDVIVKRVIEAFQHGQFKAMLPPIRAEINSLKTVGLGFSLVDGKQGEILTLRGILPGNFIDIKVKGSDLIISLDKLPKMESAHIENIRGVSIKEPKEGDLLCFVNGAWRQFKLDDFATIKALKLTNSYPDEDRKKLSEIQPGAEKNPAASDIKVLYESNANTNPFTNEDKAILEDVKTKAHSHKNRELLDSYDVPNESIKRASDSAHVHPNSDVLSKIVSAGSGKIITPEERSVIQEIASLLPSLKKLLQ